MGLVHAVSFVLLQTSVLCVERCTPHDMLLVPMLRSRCSEATVSLIDRLVSKMLWCLSFFSAQFLGVWLSILLHLSLCRLIWLELTFRGLLLAHLLL